ncbi:MAG: DUF2628 domain-containing protein [Persephonella sp.]|nr:MAG: DUF2628 domain-containing protein [Persephonella sp.]
MVVKKLFEEFDEDTLKAYVQGNNDYYLIRWKWMSLIYSRTTWNWPAFFFPIHWLAYRKMYSYLFIFFIPYLLFAILGIDIILRFILGIYGNYLYAKHTYKKLKKLKITANSDEEFKNLIEKKGGTSVLSVLIVIIIPILLIAFFVITIVLLQKI